MSLITRRSSRGANPFEYLTELQRNAAKVRDTPGEWMPWNYREIFFSELDGGQDILNLRVLVLSQRWETFWKCHEGTLVGSRVAA